MNVRHLGISSVLTAILAAATAAAAQTPAPPTPLYPGSLGGGFALTSGNTDTRNFNLAGEIVRNPKTKNVIKGTASYLRGTSSDVLNLDRTSVNVRNEYTISNRTFAFGQVDYLRDQFKEIIFFWAATRGVGYRLIDTEATQFIVDGGAGGVIEKNPGTPSTKSPSLTAGERFRRQLSSTSTFTQASYKRKQRQSFSSLTNTTPSAPLRNGDILLMAQPPLLG
jgi:putative salt-induced outer membrane protein